MNNHAERCVLLAKHELREMGEMIVSWRKWWSIRRRQMDSFDSTACLLMIGALVMSTPARSAEDRDVHAMNGHREAALVRSLEAVQRGEIDEALAIVERLVGTEPGFRLAQLVRGDLLMAKAGKIDRVGAGVDASSSRLRSLLDEARARSGHRRRHPAPNTLPASLIRLSPSYERVLVADVSESRLYLFENRGGDIVLVSDFYVTSGRGGPFKTLEGDLKTPIGVYFVNGRIESSRLPELYGAGALPLDYPNEWDRRLGRTGYGIWLHGVPFSTYSRAPRATEGCLALPNEDFRTLWELAETGDRRTPVIIVDRVQWISRAESHVQRAAIDKALTRWRRAWESRDASQYAMSYSPSFRAGSLDYGAWLARKRRVNAAKRFIRVGIREVNMFAYPGEPGLRVVSFDQTYESDNLKSQTRKTQYWKREDDGTWRIVYEGAA